MAMSYYVRESGYSLAQSYKNMIKNLSIWEEKEKICKEENERLKKDIEELKLAGTISALGDFRGLSTAYLNIPEVSIKNSYIRYIETFGIPEDGYFIPELLEELS